MVAPTSALEASDWKEIWPRIAVPRKRKKNLLEPKAMTHIECEISR